MIELRQLEFKNQIMDSKVTSLQQHFLHSDINEEDFVLEEHNQF
jgi:hypothetical protein